MLDMSISDISINTLSGQPTSLGGLGAKVMLVVNVASKCGLTPQYTGLEALHAKYAGQGFSVVGVPCNQFMGQEPGSPEEIATFCSTTYGVTFPLLEKIDVNGVPQEAVRIIYKDNDVLYVNINSLHKITKYAGKEGSEPKIHKIGSGVWEKLKTKTKKQIKDIAGDLIKLYAQRKASKGFMHSPDSYMQTELEASFMYEDTPDQSKATADVKKDMEADAPMDRLVCGDVGFGKTEVAIRAAFKSVVDGKQAVILVPTTILYAP
jgi:glutathione peroxidase-family protein